MNIDIVMADYSSPQHAQDIPMLLDAYAKDPMGGETPLDDYVKDHLVKELSRLPNAFSLIAYVDGVAAGLANCFESFSTFLCKPVINIHDIIVTRSFRGLGISQKLLFEIETIAISKDCCKITLEVLSNNHVAQSAYRKFGFTRYQLTPETGTAEFWHKKLETDHGKL